MSIEICLAGATGNVGRELVKTILRSDDLRLAAAVGKTSAGQSLGKVLGEPRLDLQVDSSVEEALARSWDILIDYTAPDAVKGNVVAALNGRRNVVIGTSGLTDMDYVEIEELALEKGVGVLAAGNFSITATLVQHFARLAAEYLPTWEILDYASDAKPDSPSGTAREIAYTVGKVAKPRWAVPVAETQGPRDSRGTELNGTLVHSIRVPGFYSSLEVMFGSSGERLSLRHDSMSYQPYIEGTLLAVREVGNFVGLRRGLASVMNLK
jgi:4-hydroxy-tetrahydrodipicolinate reductase